MKINACWLYAISKYGYPPSIPDTHRAIDDISRLGFKHLELEAVGRPHLDLMYSHRVEIKRHCEDIGIEVVNFCPILPDLVSLDAKTRSNALDDFQRIVELGAYFGCRTIQTDSYVPPVEFAGDVPYRTGISFDRQFDVILNPDFSWDGFWKVVVDSFTKCAELSARAGLLFCIEPRVGEIVSNTDALLRLIDASGSKNLGAAYDTGHQHAQKEILPLSIEKLGSRVFYVHVSDNDGRTNEHLTLGEGTINWRGFFAALKKHKYDGFVAIDVGGVQDMDRAYRQSKEFLEEISQELAM